MTIDNIEFNIDEQNELTFQVSIEAPELVKPTYRFVLTDEGMSYSLPGVAEGNGTVKVVVPPMKNLLKEGAYNAMLEVIIDDKYFVPAKMEISLKQPVKVHVESVVATKTKQPLKEEAKPAPEKQSKPASPIKVTAKAKLESVSNKPQASKRPQQPAKTPTKVPAVPKAKTVSELRQMIRELAK